MFAGRPIVNDALDSDVLHTGHHHRLVDRHVSFTDLTGPVNDVAIGVYDSPFTSKKRDLKHLYKREKIAEQYFDMLRYHAIHTGKKPSEIHEHLKALLGPNTKDHEAFGFFSSLWSGIKKGASYLGSQVLKHPDKVIEFISSVAKAAAK